MAAFSGRLPSLRLPRLAVAGSARVRAALGIMVVLVLLLAVYWLAQRPTSPASTVTRTPALDPKPGDANNSDYLRGLAIDKAHRDAEAARATGQTTTPDKERHLLKRGALGIDAEVAAEAQILVEPPAVSVDGRGRPAQMAEQRQPGSAVRVPGSYGEARPHGVGHRGHFLSLGRGRSGHPSARATCRNRRYST